MEESLQLEKSSIDRWKKSNFVGRFTFRVARLSLETGGRVGNGDTGGGDATSSPRSGVVKQSVSLGGGGFGLEQELLARDLQLYQEDWQP